jgi:hypothetical protein
VPFFESDLVHSFEGAFKSLAEYEARIADAPAGSLCGEASVQYLLSERAAQEIHDYNPQARVIIMLRDPVELVYSLHSDNLWMHEKDIQDSAQAHAAEPRRRNNELLPPGNHLVQGLFCREIGHLYPQVIRFLDAFGDSNVLVIMFRDFISDTDLVARKTFSFLGLRTDVPLKLEVINSNKTARGKILSNFTQRPHPKAEAVFLRIAPRQLHGKVMPWLGGSTRGRSLVPHSTHCLHRNYAKSSLQMSESFRSSWAATCHRGCEEWN